MKKRERCWSNREQAWRQSTEFRCQRYGNHSGLHSHIYTDGKLEWDDDGNEYLNGKKVKKEWK